MSRSSNINPERKWPTALTALALALVMLVSACAAPSVSTPGADSAAAALACALPSNCVNSLAASGPAPLRFVGTSAQAMAALKATLARFPQAQVVRADDATLTAIFTTPAGFQDRVDFIVDAPRQRIDYRSQSRFGLYDFGKNRARMAAFAEQFEQTRGP
jgi:uncharacterized protein (DUF1499 family)